MNRLVDRQLIGSYFNNGLIVSVSIFQENKSNTGYFQHLKCECLLLFFVKYTLFIPILK